MSSTLSESINTEFSYFPVKELKSGDPFAKCPAVWGGVPLKPRSAGA